MGSRPSSYVFTNPGPLRLYSTTELLTLPAPTWLVDTIIPAGGAIALWGMPGAAKAQPLDEPVLTPTGWKPMGSIQPNDEVIGSAGLPVRVVAVHPRPDEEEWVVRLTDGTTIFCSRDHLWHVRKGKAGGWKTLSTEALVYTGHHSEAMWNLPWLPPVAFREHGDPLPLHPYLLGVLLGDGGLTIGTGLTTADPDILLEVEQALPAGHDLTGSNCPLSPYAFHIGTPKGQPNYVWLALQWLGLAYHKSPDKFIPELYLYAPPAERLALLQGLMDTDGFVADGNGRSVCFSSSARALTEGVQFLARSLGGVTRPIRVKQTTGLDAYAISFRMPSGVLPFKLPRKANRVCGPSGRSLNRRIESVGPTGRTVDMRCLTVAAPDGLYVTRDFTLTHNSFVAIDLALSIATGRDWNGHAVKRGFVVYVSAEGGAGIGKRARAWLQANNVAARDVDLAWLVESLHVGVESDQLEAFCNRLETEVRRDPTFIVIDTLARCFEGDENLQEDMNHFVAGVDMLRKRFSSTVAVVHHSRLDGTRERGSSSFQGAMDTMMSVEKADKQVVIKCRKQKDAEDFADIQLELTQVEGTDSCVVIPSSLVTDAAQALDELVTILAQVQPVNWDGWMQATGLTTSQFMKRYTKLKTTGRVSKDKASGLWTVTQQ